MFVVDNIKSLVSLLWNLWLNLNKRPKITCDIRYSCPIRWYPDSWDPNGKLIEGISIEVTVPFLVSNNGSVDTTIKNIYVSIKYNKDKSVCLMAQHWDANWDITNARAQPTQIMPRSIWGIQELEFSCFLGNVHELPIKMAAELVIEPVAQGPVRSKLELCY
jgi:hypothetical protein